jgi:hypothetical protein
VLFVAREVDTRIHVLRAVMSQLRVLSGVARGRRGVGYELGAVTISADWVRPGVVQAMVRVVGQVIGIERAWQGGIERDAVILNVWREFEAAAGPFAVRLSDPAVADAHERARLYEAMHHAVLNSRVVPRVAAVFLDWMVAAYSQLADAAPRQAR